MELAALHAEETAKDFSTLLADEALLNDKEWRHPRYFQPEEAAGREMRDVGGQDTGYIPGRILNSPLSTHVEKPHGSATRN